MVPRAWNREIWFTVEIKLREVLHRLWIMNNKTERLYHGFSVLHCGECAGKAIGHKEHQAD